MTWQKRHALRQRSDIQPRVQPPSERQESDGHARRRQGPTDDAPDSCMSAFTAAASWSTRSTGPRKARDTGESCCAALSASRAGRASSSRRAVERLDDELDRATAELLSDLRRMTHANMSEEIEFFVRALDADLIVPSTSELLSGSARRPRRRPDPAAPRAPRAGSSAAPPWPRARCAARARAPHPARRCAAIRSHSVLRLAGPCSEARSSSARSRSRSRARMRGSVTVPSSRSVPRDLPVRSDRSGHVEHVVEQLERQPDRRANEPSASASARSPSRPERPELGTPPRTAPRSSARSAAGSARPERRVARRPRAAAARRWPARGGRATAPAAARRRRCAPARANARENSRSPVATAPRGPPAAATVGRPRRSGAPSITSSCTSVAECTSSTATAARDQSAPRRRLVRGAGRRQRHTSSGRRRLPPRRSWRCVARERGPRP